MSSVPGQGSTFSATIPVVYRRSRERSDLIAGWVLDPAKLPVLVVADAFETQLFYEKILKHSRFQLLPVRSSEDASEALGRIQPAVVLLDVLLDGGDGEWAVLAGLRQSHPHVPVVVVSAVADEQKGRALGAAACGVRPVDRNWLVSTLERVTGVSQSVPRVLIVEDQPAMRYVLTQLVDASRHMIEEAASGAAGLAAARRQTPDVILLDLGLPDIAGTTVLSHLKSDPATAHVSVIVVTASRPQGAALDLLRTQCVDVLPKELLTRERVSQALNQALSRRAEAAARG